MKLPLIKEQEVLHYLGCKQGDDVLRKTIQEMIDVIFQSASPRVLWREFILKDGQPVEAFHFPGNDITRLWKESHACIIMAATLGVQVDREIKKRNIKDMGEALVLDACANAGIEAVCDQFCVELAQMYETKKCYLTDRFSCGYGDLPINIQTNVIKTLDAQKKIGLHVNENQILIPCKSVTAIMGVAKTIQPYIVRGCQVCRLRETCAYHRGGTTCGK